MASRWQLLTTLSDAPSAEALASMLRAEGITVRVASEAQVLGQAVPCRLLVETAQLAQARWALSQHALSEEELLSLATGKVPL
jgi:hypothetical protein